MGYLSGLGDIALGDFVNRSGNCKPTNFETLAKFKELQTQLNRAAHAKGLPKIAVDGDIGPGTLALMAKLGVSAATSCATVAPIAEALAVQMRETADNAGVPTKVSSPAPPVAPSIVNATTGAITPQPTSASIMDAFNRMGTTELIIAAAVLGGGAYFLLGKKKRRG